MFSAAARKIFQRQEMMVVILVFFSLIIFFFDLGKKSFWEPDEGRYAEIAREMVESGDWLTPRLNYLKHFDKPPLTYWLIGSSFKLFGQSEFAGHLPLVILGSAGILVTFFLGQCLFGRRVGLLSGVILGSSLGYPAIGRILSTDIVFTFFCLLCYLCFVQKKYFFFYLTLGLGFLTKGPVTLVLTLLPICAFLVYTKDRKTLTEMRLGRGLILVAALSSPWFIYQALLNKGLIQDWILQQTLGRIIRQYQQPFYFFIPVLLGLFFPWIFFLGPALIKYLSFKRTFFSQEQRKLLLLFFWFILPFIFFSCIGKKLVPYILPLLPALAIIVARLWDDLFDRPRILASKIVTLFYYLFLLTLGMLALATLVFLLAGFDFKLGIAPARPNIILISIILTIAFAVSLTAFKLGKPGGLFRVVTITAVLFFLTTIDMLPKIESQIGKSIKGLALKIKADLRPEDKVVNYRCFLKSLPFYLSRRTIVVERERNLAYEARPQDSESYLLKDKNDLYRLLAAKDFGVFCITYPWEYAEIKEEYPQPLYRLGQAGKYVLFTNQVR